MTTIYGLTGGVGMGKSAAADALRARSIAVVDSDAIARQIVEPGQPALVELCAVFGAKVIGADGYLDRVAMAKIVFADTAARQRLEAILHPRIRAIWQAQVAAWRAEGRAVGVAVIPLLFETGAQVHFDKTLCVACSPARQRERLRARGWSEEEGARRMAAQWPVERKMAAADFVVWSEGSLDVLAEQLRRIIP
jgi:dephospho-CoA kinase